MIELEDKKEKIRFFLEYVRDRVDPKINQSVLSIVENYMQDYAKGQIKKDMRYFRDGLLAGKDFGELLHNKKYINNIHKLIVDNAGSNLAKALDNILETMQESNRATKIYLSTTFMLFASFGTLLFMGLYPKPMKTMITAMSMAKDPSIFLPFYLKEPMWLIVTGLTPMVIIALMFVYYKLYKNKNPKLIYKVSELDQYEDAIIIISILKALVDVGLTLQDAFLKLYETSKNPYHKKMFKAIYLSYEEGKNGLVSNFKRFGFNPIVYERFDLIEKGGEVEGNLEKALELVIRARDRKLDLLEKVLPSTARNFSMILLGLLTTHLFALQFDATMGLKH